MFGLFELPRDTAAPVQLVGYATAYTFTNPFLTGRQKLLRLAQLVVLPAWQRQGHGFELLRVLHNINEKEDYLEFNVEAPCRGMTLLRDKFDVATYKEHPVISTLVDGVDISKESFDCLTKAQVAELKDKLRLSDAQCVRLFELLLYKRLCGDGGISEASLKAFRLMVKRRLLAEDAELQALQDADVRKQLLEEMWVDLHRDYRAVLIK